MKDEDAGTADNSVDISAQGNVCKRSPLLKIVGPILEFPFQILLKLGLLSHNIITMI